MGYYLQSIKSESFVILLHTFTLVEYTFFCAYIYLILPQSFLKKIIPYLWIGFIIFALVDLVYVNTGIEFDSIAIGIESLIVILLCIYYLFIQIKGTNSLVIYSTFNFWVIITFLIYFSGTFFLYILAQELKYNVAFRKDYFIINISFNILKNILLCVAMTMKSNDIVNEQKSAIPELDEDFFISKKIN